MAFLPFLHRVLNRENLPAADARAAMASILAGEATTAQIAAFAASLRVKGETAAEIQGLAQAMRDAAMPIVHGITDRPVLDTCGTGGDGQGTINVSTIVAITVAACGVAVAKHGNRSLSSQCGSADLLEALGMKILTDPGLIARSIREVGFGFLFAPVMHQAMKYAQPARAELKTRTAFNLLGPLTNPAGATAQLVGAPSVASAELMAVVLSNLGLKRGYVVHGHDGLDEVSTTGESHLFGIVGGAIDHRMVAPEEFGVTRVRIEQLRGGDIAANREITLGILQGETGPFRDIVLVNASIALAAAGVVTDFRAGVAIGAEAIDSGRARAKLEEIVEFSRTAAA
ncbi:MAG TPA: anthranilate phosphoribosyltransferase [Paludibaculum sp.]|jgi:anthranilate phosphoribosyltransferase